MSPYSLAIRQEAVRKTLHRESGRTIAQMADELNVPYHSLRKWLQDFRMSEPTAPQPTEKRAADYSAEQRLQAVLDTHAMTPEARSAWCREHGLFEHQLAQWKAQLLTPAEPAGNAGEVRRLRDEVKQLERQLNRRDKALARADGRPQRQQHPHNRLSDLERQEVLALLNSPAYADLPPSQIVPRLADQGQYVASESTLYRVLRQAGQLKHRGAG